MIIQTNKALEEALKYCAKSDTIAFDVETSGFLCNDGRIVGWAIGDKEAQFYAPIRHTLEAKAMSQGYNNMHIQPVKSAFKEFFRQYKGNVIGHNIKFDINMSAKEFFFEETRHKDLYKFWQNKSIFDTLIMYHLLDEEGLKDLKHLYINLCDGKNTDEEVLKNELKALKTHRKAKFAETFLEAIKGKKKIWRPGKEEALKDWEKRYENNYGDVSIPVCGAYACKDIVRTLEIFDKLIVEYMKPCNAGLLTALEHEQGNILPTASMETRGMTVNNQYYVDLIPDYEARICQLQEGIEKLTRQKFNMNSSAEKHIALYSNGARGFLPSPNSAKALKYFAKTRGYPNVESWQRAFPEEVENHPEFKPSTNKASLKNVFLRSNSTVRATIELMQEFSGLDKVITTYLSPLARFSRYGAIHCSVNQQGTVTGRASSDSPNMQNMPKDDPVARRGFTPRPGYVLVFFDYDQMEMRLAGHFAEVPKLVKLFADNKDPYIYLASIGNHCKYEEVTKKARKIYKAVGLASIYGSGVDGLLLLTPEAKEILRIMDAEFPEIFQYAKKLERDYRRYNYMEILYGRRRRIVDSSESYKLFNSKVQGAGAMMIKKAQRESTALCLDMLSSLLLPVHDELIFEIHETELFLIPQIKQIMENFKTIIPCTVGVEYTVTDWADKKKWEGELDDGDRRTLRERSA